MIRLDLAQSPFPPPEGLLEELRKAVERINLYPSGSYEELKQAYATYADVEPSNVFVGNGLDEVIDIITRAFGKRILIPVPTFSQFEKAGIRNRSELLMKGCFDGEIYKPSFDEKELRWATLVWVCNPNNPTGDVIQRSVIERIKRKVRGVLCVDEAYYEFSGETAVNMLDERLIVLRGLSKGFGLAGLRIGFALSDEKNIEKLERMRQPFNVNLLAEVAGKSVFKYLDYYEEVRKEVERIKVWFAKRLGELGLLVLPSKTNFLLVKFRSMEMMEDICRRLRNGGIRVFSAGSDEFSGLEGPFVRFTMGRMEDMERVVEILEKC